MYNFSIPSSVKAWLDGSWSTPRREPETGDGPVAGKRSSRPRRAAARTGGDAPRALEFQESYLRAVFASSGWTGT